MDENHVNLRGISHYGKPSLINEIQDNLKSYLDWSLLNIGAWHNIQTGTRGVFGGSFGTLQVVDDPSYTANTVYQGIRKDWIWESGVNYTNPTGGVYNPLPVQIYVNNSLVTTGTSGSTHYINYPLGRVIFDNPQTNVKAAYSYRQVQVYLSDDINWWFEVQYDTHNPADLQWAQNITSGDYSLSSTNRMQLPAIIIEPVARRYSVPFELGTLTAKNRQDIMFHVIAETRRERNDLVDYLALQKDKSIILYDTTALYENNKFPLDYRGMKVSNPTMYPDIVNDANLQFRQATFNNIVVSEIKTNHPKLNWAIVKMTIEVIY